MNFKPSPIFLAVCVVFIAGFLSLFSKTLMNAGLSPVDVGMIREVGTAVFFAMFLIMFDRKAFRIRLKDVYIFAIFALFNVVSNLAMFTALNHIPTGMASVLQMTNPYFVMVFSLILFKISITRTKILASLVTLTGCTMIIGLFDDSGHICVEGISMALLSAVTLAAFTIGGRFIGDRGYSENTAMMYFFGFSALMIAPLADHQLVVDTLTSDISFVFDALCLCLICTLLVNFLIIYCTRRMDPGIFSIIMSTSVVVSTILGAIFFDEVVRPLGIVGIALVIAGMVILEKNSLKRRKQAQIE